MAALADREFVLPKPHTISAELLNRQSQAFEPKFHGQHVTTGDLVLFSGKNPAQRHLQERMGSPWGRVGMVIYPPGFIEPCVLTATSFPTGPDIETGDQRIGVLTTRLHATALAFDGRISLRYLDPPLTPDLVEMLFSFRNSVDGRPFDFSQLSLRRTLRRSHTSWEPNVFMCASLVAFAYQSIGVLPLPPQGPLPNNTWPRDFSAGGKIRLTHGYSLRSQPRRCNRAISHPAGIPAYTASEPIPSP